MYEIPTGFIRYLKFMKGTSKTFYFYFLKVFKVLKHNKKLSLLLINPFIFQSDKKQVER